MPYHSTANNFAMPTASPFVSVIIPAYNAGDTVRRCVESVLSQTFTDIEVIVVDDGSRDDTLAVLRQMQTGDARLVVHHQENAGVSTARNAGLALARGEWVAFVDSDDYVAEDYIATLLPQTDNLDFTMCSLASVDANGRETVQRMMPDLPAGDVLQHAMSIGEALSSISVYHLCGPCCKLFRHSMIVDFDIRFPLGMSFGEDALFVFTYLQHAARVQAVNVATYYYTHSREESLSSTSTSVQWYDMALRIQQLLEAICQRHHVTDRSRIEAHVLDRLTTALSLTTRDHLMTRQLRYASYRMIADFVSPRIYRPHMPFFFPLFAYLRWWRGYEWLVRKIYR